MRCIIILLFYSVFLGRVYADNNITDQNFSLTAHKIEYYKQSNQIKASGDIKIVFNKYLITADQIIFDIKNDTVLTHGEAKIEDNQGNFFTGSSIVFKRSLKNAIIRDFYLNLKNNAFISAKLAERVNNKEYNAEDVCYTSCIVEKGYFNPVWQIKAKKGNLNFSKEKMVYKNVFFEVYGVPIFFSPIVIYHTPKAKAKSGFLLPYIKYSGLNIPLYLRPKPNLDGTVSNRISRKEVILEGELRHLSNYGKSIVNISFPIKKDMNRHFMSIKNQNNYQDIEYGFNFEKVSDKAFLKNYYNRYDSYLRSDAYIQKINGSNYYRIEGLHFQDLRSDNVSDTDPFVIPAIRNKYTFNTNDWFFTFNNNSIIYRLKQDINVLRLSPSFYLNKSYINDHGHVFNIGGYNRVDIYHIENNLSDKDVIRNIPEINLGWQYPLLYKSIILEPRINTIFNNKSRYIIDPKIDSQVLEINDINFFNHNHYSGVDIHEAGNRVSYGLNALNSNFNAFLGQIYFLNKNSKIPINKQVVGKLNLYFDRFDISNRFNLSDKLSPNIVEFNLNYNIPSFFINLNFIKLYNTGYYLPINKYKINDLEDKLTFLVSKLRYRVSEHWFLNHESYFKIGNDRGIHSVMKSIGMTYLTNCVSITTKISDDYTTLLQRKDNKYKKHSISLQLRLKTMNM